jgi:hypothetical protein
MKGTPQNTKKKRWRFDNAFDIPENIGRKAKLMGHRRRDFLAKRVKVDQLCVAKQWKRQWGNPVIPY